MIAPPPEDGYDPGPGEPYLGPYTAVPLATWTVNLLPARTGSRPLILGIDGRGGSGKSTLAARIAALTPSRAAIVHTDDLAWNHSIVGWHQLLIDDVLTPLARGIAVNYRPRTWVDHERAGSIVVPADSELVIVEGTGTISDSVRPHLDATVWLQSDYQLTRERVIARDAATGVNGDHAAATRFWADWQSEEVPFLQRQRPWAHADAIVDGSHHGLPDSFVPASPSRAG